MLLEKVGSACGKIAMYFKIQRDSPRGCGVASYISLIQFHPDSTSINYVAIHKRGGFIHGVMSCPNRQSCVIECLRFPCGSCVHTRVCSYVCCSCVHVYTYTEEPIAGG